MRLKIIVLIAILFVFGILHDIKISQSNYENKKNEIMIKSDEDHFTTNNILPKMDIELDNGVHVTGAVLVHNGEGYALTEEEYNLLRKGIDPEEIVSKRK